MFRRLLIFLLLLLGLWLPVSHAQIQGSGASSSLAVPNDPTVGTTLNLLAKVDTTGAKLATTADTGKPLYVVTGGAGTNANVLAILAQTGTVSLVMDATLSNTRGMYVVQSATTDGRGHPLSPLGTAPSSGYVIGIMHDNSTTAGQPALIEATQINYSPGSGTGTGTVISVAQTVPASILTISGSPINSSNPSGTLAIGLANQSANCIMAGPPSGAPAPWGCRPMVLADFAGLGVAAGAAGGDLAGTYPNPTVAKVSGTFAWTSIVTPTALAGTVNDYSGCAGAAICRMDPGTSADALLTGLDASTAVNGRTLTLCNIGTSKKITLVNAGGSSAANRFKAHRDLVLLPDDCKQVWYDTPALRWRPFDSGLLDSVLVKTCTIPFGSTDTSAPPLSDTDDAVASCGNNTALDWRITGVKVYSNTGTPSFNPVLTGGTATSILTGPCTATAGAWTACSLNATPPIVHSFSGSGSATCSVPSCTIDGNLQSAGGVATYGLIEITGVLQ